MIFILIIDDARLAVADIRKKMGKASQNPS